MHQTSNVISDSFLKSTKLDREKVREGPPLRGGVPAVPRRAPPPHHRAGAHARALPLLAPSAAARAASTSLFSKWFLFLLHSPPSFSFKRMRAKKDMIFHFVCHHEMLMFSAGEKEKKLRKKRITSKARARVKRCVWQKGKQKSRAPGKKKKKIC